MIAVVDGIAFSAGVLVPQLLQAFGASDTKTALVASVLNGFYLGAGELMCKQILQNSDGFRVQAGCTECRCIQVAARFS